MLNLLKNANMYVARSHMGYLQYALHENTLQYVFQNISKHYCKYETEQVLTNAERWYGGVTSLLGNERVWDWFEAVSRTDECEGGAATNDQTQHARVFRQLVRVIGIWNEIQVTSKLHVLHEATERCCIPRRNSVVPSNTKLFRGSKPLRMPLAEKKKRLALL